MKIKWIHIKAFVVYLIYTLTSKYVLLIALISYWNLKYTMIHILLNSLFAMTFLYLFEHDDFFTFAKDIERKELKREKKFEEKYIHHGKLLGSFLILILGGPLIGALAFRLIIKSLKFRYGYIFLGSAISALLILILVGQGILIL